MGNAPKAKENLVGGSRSMAYKIREYDINMT